jgi:hypothetical protein
MAEASAAGDEEALSTPLILSEAPVEWRSSD